VADDEITDERRELLDEVKTYNDELVRLGVPTRLPMLLALRITIGELRPAVKGLRRHYLDVSRKLGGSV